MDPVRVKKGRVNTLPVSLGYDVSNDTITSQIRKEKDHESELIASWDVAFLTDGVDGELILTLDDSAREIESSGGWMDFKRVSNGQPLDAVDEPLEVLFVETVTV